MSMTSVDFTPPSRDAAVNRCVITRAVLAVVGSALAFSAFALWLVPGSSNDPELSLMKLGLSLFMLIAGAACYLSARGACR